MSDAPLSPAAGGDSGGASNSSLPALLDHLVWADARVLAGLHDSPGRDSRALELFRVG